MLVASRPVARVDQGGKMHVGRCAGAWHTGVMRDEPGPVTADDVDEVLAAAVRGLGSRLDRDWRVAAGELDWDCWETVEHVADDLFAYAAQLTAKSPPLTAYLPIEFRQRRPGAPDSTILADPKAGTAGLVKILDACGGLLSSVVRTTAPTVRAYHPYGISDAEGFAAMGLVEMLVHLADVASVLEFEWAPAEDLCARVLFRLFPEAPTSTERWATLLWATGRGAMPGHPRLDDWRWHGQPREV
jgi:hypothetical protein